jgi:hypothetical protein
MGLAFGFDDTLEGAESGGHGVDGRDHDNVSPSPYHQPSVAAITSPTSPATQELNSKIASCKNYWELPQVFDKYVTCCSIGMYASCLKRRGEQ